MKIYSLFNLNLINLNLILLIHFNQRLFLNSNRWRVIRWRPFKVPKRVRIEFYLISMSKINWNPILWYFSTLACGFISKFDFSPWECSFPGKDKRHPKECNYKYLCIVSEANKNSTHQGFTSEIQKVLNVLRAQIPLL